MDVTDYGSGDIFSFGLISTPIEPESRKVGVDDLPIVSSSYTSYARALFDLGVEFAEYTQKYAFRYGIDTPAFKNKIDEDSPL